MKSVYYQQIRAEFYVGAEGPVTRTFLRLQSLTCNMCASRNVNIFSQEHLKTNRQLMETESCKKKGSADIRNVDVLPDAKAARQINIRLTETCPRK